VDIVVLLRQQLQVVVVGCPSHAVADGRLRDALASAASVSDRRIANKPRTNQPMAIVYDRHSCALHAASSSCRHSVHQRHFPIFEKASH